MRFAAALGCCCLLGPAPVGALAQVSVAAGAGTVRASDGSATGAATVAPRWQAASATTAADVQLVLARFPHGDGNAQLLVDAWRRVGAIALTTALQGSLGPGRARAGSGLLLVDFSRGGREAGVAFAAGPALGAIGGEHGVTGTRMRTRAWYRPGGSEYAATIDATRLRGAWHVDATASATFEMGPVTAGFLAVGRTGREDVSRGTGGVFIVGRLSSRVTVEGRGGGFLSDPLLGLARATALSVGARVLIGRPPVPPGAPLVASWLGEYAVVRLRVPGATRVALAGEWASWAPQPLRRLRPGADTWEGMLRLEPGTYRFNLVVDGMRWTVPPGVATLGDGLGGRVALLVIPSGSP